MSSALSSPCRVVSSDRKSCHWRRVSAMAPDTAFAKLSPTMPRGVVGSVAFPVSGSISPLSLLSAACVTRCAHSRDAGSLVAQARSSRSCRSERHPRGRRAAKVEHRARPGQVQTWRVVDSDRTAGVRFICPVAVRVEVLCPVQDSPEPFDGRTFGAVLARDRPACTPARFAPRPRSPDPGRRGDPGRCRPLPRTDRAGAAHSP